MQEKAVCFSKVISKIQSLGCAATSPHLFHASAAGWSVVAKLTFLPSVFLMDLSH